MNYFIDIDGTLTDFWGQGGTPIPGRIQRVKDLIAEGHVVVLWSGGGKDYARNFAIKHGIDCLCLGKPDVMVDDTPTLRPQLETESSGSQTRPGLRINPAPHR